MNAATGELFGFAREPIQQANVTVIASAQGRTISVNGGMAFALTVVDCEGTTTCHGGTCIDDIPFDGKFFCNCSGTGHVGPRCDEAPLAVLQVEWPGYPRLWTRTALHKAYNTEQPAHVIVLPDQSATVRYSASGLPCGMTVNTSTGQVGGTPGASGNYTQVSIFAEASGQTARVNHAVFALEVVDCDDKLTCNGGLCIDEVAFDGAFRCDCSHIHTTGSFCEVVPQQSTQGSNAATIPVIVGVSGYVLWRQCSFSPRISTSLFTLYVVFLRPHFGSTCNPAYTRFDNAEWLCSLDSFVLPRCCGAEEGCKDRTTSRPFLRK